MNKEYKKLCMYSLKNTHTCKLSNQIKKGSINIPQKPSCVLLKLYVPSSLSKGS